LERGERALLDLSEQSGEVEAVQVCEDFVGGVGGSSCTLREDSVSVLQRVKEERKTGVEENSDASKEAGETLSRQPPATPNPLYQLRNTSVLFYLHRKGRLRFFRPNDKPHYSM
jgi:hypothetical protein